MSSSCYAQLLRPRHTPFSQLFTLDLISIGRVIYWALWTSAVQLSSQDLDVIQVSKFLASAGLHLSVR